jgi:hypothetical protein
MTPGIEVLTMVIEMKITLQTQETALLHVFGRT